MSMDWLYSNLIIVGLEAMLSISFLHGGMTLHIYIYIEPSISSFCCVFGEMNCLCLSGLSKVSWACAGGTRHRKGSTVHIEHERPLPNSHLSTLSICLLSLRTTAEQEGSLTPWVLVFVLSFAASTRIASLWLQHEEAFYGFIYRKVSFRMVTSISHVVL
ncbi:hypothetical protein TEQG_06659 [Trichophyton equinum CBS 127.97]|uniref:Uncharacterized protein n=1 Tax=Trichophyton equinum (strain ATCC MYA-4606 / CBS 127.97) TaxID=559882 RepID=F2Q0K7_TRIEC|nr:hypothetical protein TEQG_06659 [Trichophyton equinum CBS 127.97]